MRLTRLLPLIALLSGLGPPLASAEVPGFLNEWGGQGAAPGQLHWPYGLATAPDGAVYVTDQLNYRIEEFGPMGDYLRSWGTAGNAPGQFGQMIGVCATTDRVFVADYSNRRVQVFDRNGQFVRVLATGIDARDVAVASNGEIFVVTDPPGNPSHVNVYDASGTLLRVIANSVLTESYSIAFASDGTLLVTRTGYSSPGILRFDPNTGNYLGAWDVQWAFTSNYGGVQSIGVGPDGRVYVCDYYNVRVAVFSASGGHLGVFGDLGRGVGQLLSPVDVAVGPDGSVYIADYALSKVAHYSYGVTAGRRESWGELKLAFREK